MNRFERQINLRGFGEEGQKKLKAASVLVVGAGGLGCPALLYLSAAGIGRIGIVDGDTISVSNLNRQILFNESDEGKMKADMAGERIREKYNDIRVEIFSVYLRNENTFSILSEYDIVLDCTDNFSVRYMLNDACILLNKPFVYAAIYAYEGQVSLFNAENKDKVKYNYRDLFPVPSDPFQVPNCAETGVLGVLPGIIGTMQAAEAIKYLVGIGTTLSGSVLYYNVAEQQTYKMDIASNPLVQYNAPETEDGFLKFDYSFSCPSVSVIDWEEADMIFEYSPEETLFVDVREYGELPEVKYISCVQLPLSVLPRKHLALVRAKTILLFCQHGARSEKAALLLSGIYPGKSFYSIRGGIMASSSHKNR